MRDVVTDADRKVRQTELVIDEAVEKAERTAADDAARRANTNFTQVYPKGWARLQKLIQTNPPAARIYAFLAEHMDGSVGSVVVSQDVMAETIGVHERTIRRITKALEDEGAIVRIRVGTGVYAYCLDPTEVWKSWDDKKQHAAFKTKTLVRKSDKANGQVRRKLKMMMGEPELPM